MHDETRPTTDEIIAKARQIMDDDWSVDFVAVRTQEQPFEPGPIDHESVAWDDGEETDEGLGGICATDTADRRAVMMHSSDPNIFDGFYPGDHTALITGRLIGRGEDMGEVVIADANVEYIFR